MRFLKPRLGLSLYDLAVAERLAYRPLCYVFGSVLGRTAVWAPVAVGAAAYAFDIQPSFVKAGYMALSGWIGCTVNEMVEKGLYNHMLSRGVPRPKGERLLHRFQVATYAVVMGGTLVWQTLPLNQLSGLGRLDKLVQDASKQLPRMALSYK